MEIHVEKFGGASVNSANAVQNVVKILKTQPSKTVVVVSAMGKTTNSLEKILNSFIATHTLNEEVLNALILYHKNIINDLFGNNYNKDYIMRLFDNIITMLFSYKEKDYDFLYDQIISFGELISSTIISQYLTFSGIKHRFIQAKDVIKTDNVFRSANVDWNLTTKKTDEIIVPALEEVDLILTQGFIGSTQNNLTTTLGREGSDYTAAILSYCLNAKDCTIWKDVSGVLNADPKRMTNTTKIDTLSYSEAIELSYYGATIIHPKTIKPLENRNIPLYVKSFLSPTNKGSMICNCKTQLPTSYIFKDNQVLLSIFPRDFSFIAEENISSIFAILAKHRIKVNLMQNSAISFSLCFDEDVNEKCFELLLNDLQKDYKVRYNCHLQLLTIRHYTQQSIDEQITGKKILIEQRSRTTAQYLLQEV
ncbi:MAG: aspartate kinase [Bacteroidales bacterium]|jgi:aspartate kinase|nr:aspartate kinase [Bacteroidales bacterium]